MVTNRSLAELSTAFTKGLLVQFQKYYEIALPKMDPMLSRVCRMGITSDGSSESYQHWNSTPRLSRWREGFAIPSKGFEGVAWTVENLEYGRRIPVHKNAISDDRTRSAMDWVKNLALDRPNLLKRLFFQVLKAGTDVDGLDTIPTAPDGQALFSTTSDGSTARFGATGGNLLTASGVSPGNIRDDFYLAMEQFGLFTDTESRELLPKDVLDQGWIVIFPMGQLQVMEQALKQELGLLASSASAPSNLVANKMVEFWPTQYLTGTSFYVLPKALADYQAIFFQDREQLQVETSDLQNSDEAKTYGIISLQAHLRIGVGVAPPFGILKVA